MQVLDFLTATTWSEIPDNRIMQPGRQRSTQMSNYLYVAKTR